MPTEHDVQVIIVAGPGDPGRAILGFSMAASAASAGTKVYLYLAMEGAKFLTSEHCSRPIVDGYPSVAELVDVIHASNGTIAYCPNCLGEQCGTGSLDPKASAACYAHLAKAGGISTLGIRMSNTPTVVF